jgi:hypothetical protein
LIERSLTSENREKLDKIFSGSKLTITSAQEEDGTPTETRTSAPLGSLILPVPDESHTARQLTLMDCLERALTDQIEDYETERHFRTMATQSVWFEKLPPVFKIQLNRTAFVNGSPTKIHTPVQIPLRFCVDRYLLSNRSHTQDLQRQLSELNDMLALHQADLDALISYTGTPAPPAGAPVNLVRACEALSHFIREEAARQSPFVAGHHEVPAVSSFLESLRGRLSHKVTELQTTIAELKSQCDALFSPLDKDFYELQAVWIHEGVPGSGHYWVYIRTPEQPLRWFKFNDSFVTESTEEEVFERANGGTGSGRCSAYLLIYTLPGQYDFDWKEIVPPELAQSIEKDNADFARKIAEAPASSSGHSGDARTAGFFDTFNRKMKVLENLPQKFSLDRDDRIGSFEVFAHSLGKEDAAMASHFLTTYRQVFGFQYTNDIGSELQEQVANILGPEKSQTVLHYATESSLFGAIQDQHGLFRAVTDLMKSGITDMVYYSGERSLAWFFVALQIDAKLPPDFPASRRAQIYILAAEACVKLINEALRYAQIRDQNTSLRMLRLAGNFASNILPVDSRAAILTTFNQLIQRADEFPFLEQHLWPILSQLESPPPEDKQSLSFETIFGNTTIQPQPKQISQEAAEHLQNELATLYRTYGSRLPALT